MEPKNMTTETDLTQTTGKVGKIRCKGCNCVFQNVREYLASNGCDKEDCPMSKKWKARQAANAAIQKAQEGSKKDPRFVMHVRTCSLPETADEKLPYREKPVSQCIAFHIMKQ